MDSGFRVVGVVSDDPFAIDVAHYFGQTADIADLVSYKRFANTEFCPRFISDEADLDHIGNGLDGKTVVLVSTCCGNHTRNALAMRTCLLARAAKDNGAARVILVEPDLFYSAQDRGPRPEHGQVAFVRGRKDYKKFDGQPFSALLFAQLLHTSGIDAVITAHNHSVSVQRVFADEFQGQFFNLSPAELYADYLIHFGSGRPDAAFPDFVICAPDNGAAPFVKQVYAAFQSAAGRMLITPEPALLLMSKSRAGERQVAITAAADSPAGLDDVRGRDVVVFDDMVRTGSTIVECCKLLKEAGARHVIFVVTHFYSSDEVKENLNSPAIDEIVTSNTLPSVLNRDMQGRLRRKMLVLKIEKWIANFLRASYAPAGFTPYRPPYAIDVSSKNPRHKNVPESATD